MVIKKIGKIDPNQKPEAMYIDPGLVGLLCNQEEGVVIELPLIVDNRIVSLSVCVNEKAIRNNNDEVVSFLVEPEFRLLNNKYHGLYLFKGNLFHVVSLVFDKNTTEEATLNIKKLTLSEDARIKKLRKEVELLEKVAKYPSGIKRSAIPDEVKLFVFGRDEGKCVVCSSNVNLQFDHIIPVSKGGSNSEENIQLLCQQCNLKKSDNLIN